MKFSKEIVTAWHVYKNKAPVTLPSSQVAARQAKRIIRPFFTDQEITALSIAESHATFTGEGRREFDSVCKIIDKRFIDEGYL